MNKTLSFEVKHSSDIASIANSNRIKNSLKKLVFGKVATDYTLNILWSKEDGWHDACIEPRKKLFIDASASVLHYGQEIFEGMKAYKNAAGRIVVFRAGDHAKRFKRSAERLCMPPLPEDIFIRAVEEFVRLEHEWIPQGEGESLYLRPFMIAAEAALGVRPAQEFAFYIIASPVANYFGAQQKGIKLWVEQNLVRAVQGGTGEVKCGGNYAAVMKAQQIASANGCEQVVFLDAFEHRFFEELAGMNIFFVFDDKRIVTPPLRGTILHGITRASLIALAADKGLRVEEIPYSFEQCREDAAHGKLTEIFACGTAAAVVPVRAMRCQSGEFSVNGGRDGSYPVMRNLAETLQSIKCGEIADTHNWLHHVQI